MPRQGTPVPHWRTSSRCAATGTCVAVALVGPRLIGMRDTTVPETTSDHVLTFDPAAWRAFAHGLKAGLADLPGRPGGR
ncbi:DUF397 domain-containing protein [Actinomadura flavalba]|uniref:DUF397 domain-containing protein n=1 Tax=Actinomadura flavalba TaxID=1120938 RepID=UPI00047723C9|nr:DUF397 domain-containing protein [Actinomadura flavalba]